jgi:hypothetical protein
MEPSEASLIFAQTYSYLASFARLTVRSTQETSTVGTLKAIPVIFPFKSLITFPTALAAPVVEGMILREAALPALQSFPPIAVPSTVS